MFWQTGNSPRTAFDIISTCYSTLFICVWSAVHVDIPTNRRKWQEMQDFVAQLHWVFVGLFLPDLLLYVAIAQWFDALQILREAYRSVPHLPPPHHTWLHRHITSMPAASSSTTSLIPDKTLTEPADDEAMKDYASEAVLRRHPWTLTHGFYAAMGGFVLDTSRPITRQPSEVEDHDSQSRHSAHGTRFVLTPTGVCFVLKHAPELIPDISGLTIRNQSKAGSIAKALLLWQILYFCGSCALRRAQSLPLSLLEVTTLAHSLSTILTYFVWWKKPLNIMEPTLIQGEKASQLAALLLMKGVASRYFCGGLIRIGSRSESSYLQVGVDPSPSWDNEAPEIVSTIDPQTTLQLYPTDTLELEGVTYSFQDLNDPHLPSRPASKSKVKPARTLPWFHQERQPNAPIQLHCTDVLRWRLAARAIKEHGSESFASAGENAQFVSEDATLQSAITSFASGPFFLRWGVDAIFLVTLAYALPHFLAWNATFGTTIERTLWHVANVALPLIPLPIAVMAFGVRVFSKESFVGRVFVWGDYLARCIAPVIYVFATGYLLVASLRQLTSLPPEAFLAPSWSKYWPHFS